MQLKALFLSLLLGVSVLSLNNPKKGDAPSNSTHTKEVIDPNASILAAGDEAGDQAEAKWKAANQKLTAAQEEYAAFSLQHAEDAYRWQHFSTKIIFCVVILLMLAGIVFSWIQFRQGMHHPAQAVSINSSRVSATGDAVGAPADVTVEKESVTEFSASPQGIKVASSTLGVIILVISMCFFYMYLRYVYPISIENANHAVAEAKKAVGP